MDFNINNYISGLSYINKDFNSLWEEIIETVPKLTNKWVPGEANESDPLVVLLKELGIVCDKVNYNTDRNILELFPDLVTQLRTAYNVFKSMGYNPNWYRSATTSISVIYNGGVGEATSGNLSSENKNKAITLPIFTQVANSDSTTIYTLLEEINLTTGTAGVRTVPAIQGTINDFTINGDNLITINNLDSQNRLYFVQPNVAQNGIFIDSNPSFKNYSIDAVTGEVMARDEDRRNTTWKRVDNLYQYLPGSYVYKFSIDPNTGSNYIQFPDDIGQLIGQGVYIKYILSDGVNGNINRGAIDNLLTDIISADENVLPTVANFVISNNEGVQNGKDPETIEEMQHNYERVVGTFETLVTLRDYENYIYNKETSIGNHIVSNIRVSDRTNDLYNHVNYKSMSSEGTIFTSSKDVGTENSKLTAYDLRLYPLRPKENINSLSDFDETFNYSGIDEKGTTQALATTTNTPWVQAITSNIEDAKSINHDYLTTCGAPIYLDYTIKGSIYLQKTVSSTEAEEIKKAVDLAIYRNFNARELYYGEAINYTKLVDVITNADPRIQYASIAPLEYKLNGDTLEIFDSNDFDYDIVSRSILNGNLPWTQFEPFYIEWGGGTLTSYSNITSINPVMTGFHVESSEEDSQKVAIKENETMSIIAPGYRARTTYGNYLYVSTYTAETGEGGSIKEFTIKPNQPVKLKKNQGIFISEKRPNSGVVYDADAVYRIGEGSIVELNATGFEGSENIVITNTDALNLGSNITLSVLEKDITELKNSALISNSNLNPSDYRIKIATNSPGLQSMLKSEGEGNYILKTGEILLYADANELISSLEVGIIGEGNTIIKNTENTIELLNVIPTTENINDYMDNTSYIQTISSNILSYQANTVYNFGSGYILDFNKLNTSIVDFKDIILLDNEVTINYFKDDADKGIVPPLLEDDHYSLLYSLALNILPGRSQQLLDKQKVILNEEDIENKKEIDGSDNTGVYLQSSMAILYAGGGNSLPLTGEETANLTILKTPMAYQRATYFKTPESKTAPKGGNYIYAKISNAGGVSYHTISGGGLVSLGEGDKVGPLFLLKEGAKYYTGTDNNYEAHKAALTSSVDIQKEQLYNIDGFCPLYVPKDEERIDDPMDPQSFFNPTHVCNRYVLPRLHAAVKKDDGGGELEINPLQDLKINPLSIVG